MTLADFKRIFFWEYFHRLLGRTIGMVFILPWIYFLVRRRLSRNLALKTIPAFFLGGAQGLMGWYMVKSGLVDIPEVSHFRLAAHLSLAFLVAQWILWVLLDEYPPKRTNDGQPKPSFGLRAAAWGFMALVALQCVYGAFMAGKRAGWLYSTFPDMNGSYSPGPFFLPGSFLDNCLNNPSAIHYIHRALAWLALFAALALILRLRRLSATPRLKLHAKLLSWVIGGQFLLGVLTVVYAVPIPLAVAHQGGAFILLSCAVALVHDLRWLAKR